MKFRKYYKMTERFSADTWRHDWVVETEMGAVNVHVDEYKNSDGLIQRHGGVEIHYRTPPGYKQGTPPDHTNCPYNHGVCWHDGSSVAVEDELMQGFDPTCHIRWFSLAEAWAIRHFDYTKTENEDKNETI